MVRVQGEMLSFAGNPGTAIKTTTGTISHLCDGGTSRSLAVLSVHMKTSENLLCSPERAFSSRYPTRRQLCLQKGSDTCLSGRLCKNVCRQQVASLSGAHQQSGCSHHGLGP